MFPGRAWVAILGFSSVCSIPATAQRYASLTGHILDPSEAGISGAAITVVNEDTGFRRSAVSELGGTYLVSSLDAGMYKVTVRKENFQTLVRFDLELKPATSTLADFTLPVGSVLETVVVHGDTQPLERDGASTGGQFDSHEIQRLPLNGSGMLGLLEAVPGTNVTPATRGEAGQFTSSGQRPNANYFTVDGASANNGVTAGGLPAESTGGTLPAVSAFGSLDALISLEAVREFSVSTSSGSADMGRFPGAQVAVASQSGSNAAHGSTLYRWRNELLSANDWFGNQARFGRAPLRMNDLSQTFGGAVRRDRTFFFLSYHHIDLLQPDVWTQAVPSWDARQAAAPWAPTVLNLLPLPNQGALSAGLGEWVGRNDPPAGLNAGSARLDQAFGPRISLFARYSDAPSSNEFGSISINRLDLRSRTLTLGLTARVTSGIVLDTRLNESESSAHSVWGTAADTSGPGCELQPLTLVFSPAGNCDFLVRFIIGGVGQLVSGREGDRVQRQFQALQTVSFYRGKHAVSIGGDYRRIGAIRRDASGSLEVIADSVSDLAAQNNLWLARNATPIYESLNVPELSLWIGDTWHAAKRLTVTGGLRWEFSPGVVPPNSTLFYVPQTGAFNTFCGPGQPCQPLWPTSFRDLAPRLGLALRLTGDGRTVLRAGGGLYYDSAISIATDYLNGGPLGIANFVSGRAGIFSTQFTFGFLPNLRLPAVGQWNLTLERAIGTHDLLSLGYVGSAGYDFIRRELGGPGFTPTSWVATTTNNARSRYHSLQAQYRRTIGAGVEALAAYTWSHSIDNDSSDAFLAWAGPGAGPSLDRGSSDFDLRHSFTASLSYTAPKHFGGWLLSGILRDRTGFPITVQAAEEYVGISFINAFRPDWVYDQPLWLADPSSPGGRRLNPAAFAIQPAGVQGNLGRNVIAGFGMWQLDLALSREFRINDRAGLQFRIEAFNAFNHPNLADPVKYMDNPLFGQSTSMLNMMLGTGSPGSGLSPVLGSGGPRALQLGLRFHF
ncbi:MAG TPA: carboxypeptidase-like regulatory domain-containing protein [Bryobacteraceae bacterium]|nr:carboxypeptidase-like regulatory domain-containing protein [Bryobacteraceae bacterium]